MAVFASLLAVAGWTPASAAAVADTLVADVTTRALSVVWVSDAPVVDADVRVFMDAEGSDEIFDNLEVDLVSPDAALDRGIVKISVSGLAPNTMYYIGTETTSDAGDVTTGPETGRLIPVLTAARTTRANLLGKPIGNDLIADEVLEADGETVADGALLVVAVPEISRYALTAFVGDDVSAPDALADLNNLYDNETGANADVPAGARLQLTAYRGNSCPSADQKLTRMRRVPSEGNLPTITELAMPAQCFAPGEVNADLDCDGRIGVVDLARFGSRFGVELHDCRFDSQLDLDDDGRIGIVDLTRIGAVFGTAE